MNINSLSYGEKGIIKNIEGNSKLVKRLFALGCIEGTEVQLKRTAPLGDPIIINVRGFDLAIRKKDAESIKIAR
ncbi:ferrous iron transport protein A [Clostridium sp. SM-530-WT-3G]|uniref:FeoA family protein n=1 Tax=Clostridium sp. SM-530-WT-3G TaxID=2725303 RepID=UPI00145CD813|nr:ferrous iron transport protein A [Clostridium sp. SM-530-WT-3G]NME83850.1 ferrous iron transport protein A [Clostridium sp. SM-530-WT-3G]